MGPLQWCSSLTFRNSKTILFGAGLAIAQINVADGQVIAEYQAQSIIHAVKYDAEHLRVIAITSDGLIVIPISDFDTTMPYLSTLTLPTEARRYLANPPQVIPSVSADSPPKDTQPYSQRHSQQWSIIHILIVIIGGMIAIACFWMAIRSFLQARPSAPSSLTPTQSAP